MPQSRNAVTFENPGACSAMGAGPGPASPRRRERTVERDEVAGPPTLAAGQVDEVARFELGVEVRQGARLRDVFGLHGPDIDHGPVREKERLIAQIQTSPPQEDMEGLLEDLHGSDQVELSAQCRHRRLAERMWAPRDKHEDVGVHAAPDAGLEGGAGPSLAWRSIIGAGFALTRDAGLKTGAPFPAAPSTRSAVRPFFPAVGHGDGVTSTPPVTPAS